MTRSLHFELNISTFRLPSRFRLVLVVYFGAFGVHVPELTIFQVARDN